MPDPTYAAKWIPQLIAAGHSATSGLAFVRERGESIGNESWYRAWGETVATLAKGASFVDTPLHRRPTVDQIGKATRPRARGYLYNIEVAVQDPLTKEIAFHVWGVRSDKLISIGSAINMAVNSWTESKKLGRDTPPGRALGGFVSSVLNMVGEDE